VALLKPISKEYAGGHHETALRSRSRHRIDLPRERGRISQEHPWGLIDRDPDDGHLMGFVIWEASKMLPAEMIAALPTSGKHHGVAV
jgi:hypothetical protein